MQSTAGRGRPPLGCEGVEALICDAALFFESSAKIGSGPGPVHCMGKGMVPRELRRVLVDAQCALETLPICKRIGRSVKNRDASAESVPSQRNASADGPKPARFLPGMRESAGKSCRTACHGRTAAC